VESTEGKGETEFCFCAFRYSEQKYSWEKKKYINIIDTHFFELFNSHTPQACKKAYSIVCFLLFNAHLHAQYFGCKESWMGKAGQ